MSSNFDLSYVDWSEFDRNIETAQQNKIIADVMHAADNCLHSIFCAGDEPKWKHESQRDGLIKLREALIPLGDSIGVINAEKIRKYDEFLASQREARKAT
ncbi:hypothetical protein QFZ34_002091 [Phyllobacterium ifriqiyense]|uniref:Uncharacterized protein n=1 Tax=Phyllobacterium ifriqiyense TaxID=314238 RepID=A0ABU0S848_9HYPH|nr:hypothetical protein [Phyllobacterium ifriqiyense]MDQ0996909.1 hypothetical protein [Phyllobacterium ifriqiyense]